MTQNYGNQLAIRESKPSTARWIKIAAVALLLLLGAAGLFFILNPHDSTDIIMGFVSLGFALVLFFGLFALTKRMHSVVTIYEEGVVIVKGKKEHRFHFNEIAGLVDAPGGGTVVPVAGGIIGAIAIGAVSALAANAADAHRRNHRLRALSLIPANPDGRMDAIGISVVDTAGDELSEVYTQWLIKEKGINEENIKSLQIPFGDTLSLDNGAFVHKKRRGEERFEFEQLTDLDIREDSVMFFGLNEKGKNRCLIDTKIARTHNLDLLFYIWDMVFDGGEEDEGEESDAEDDN